MRRAKLVVPTSVILNILLIFFIFAPRLPLQQPPTDSQDGMIASSSNLPLLWPGKGGTFRVLYNVARATEQGGYEASVTFATHGTPAFLVPHVTQVAQRWRAPVVLTVYCPGNDAAEAMRVISYLRECSTSLDVKRFVTFHFFFDEDHVPGYDLVLPPPDCLNASFVINDTLSYRTKHKLMYPVNAARNIARMSAQTKYVLVADLELYPSANVSSGFLDLIRRHPPPPHPPRVYVLPIFEVANDTAAPTNKTDLVALANKTKVVTFHKYVCVYCHRIPKEDLWLKDNKTSTGELNVFDVTGVRKSWEPIFIGTNKEPLYDERLSWEGMSDKMVQMYEMCLMHYELHILDNAFLVHAPGIKTMKEHIDWRKTFVAKQKAHKKQILKEVHARRSPSKNCTIY